MSKIELYIDFISQPARAVFWFLKYHDIPFQVKKVVVFKGEQFQDDYRKLNPFCKVPTLVDDGLVLTESHNILRYLCKKYGLDQFYSSKDLIERCKVDTYLDWHHIGLRSHSSGLFYNRFMAPRLNREHTAEALPLSEKALVESLKLVEKIFLKNGEQDYLIGANLTIADFSCYCEIIQLKLFNFNFTQFPTLMRWMSRMESLKGYQGTHELYFNLVKKFVGKY